MKTSASRNGKEAHFAMVSKDEMESTGMGGGQNESII
jgi:hypothetical protein